MHQVFLLAAHRLRVAAIRIHDPQVVGAAPVTDEGDGAAVGAEAGLKVPRQTAGESAGLASLHGHRVDISQHVENQCLAVGTDIDTAPGGLIRVDDDGLQFPRRVAHLPRLGVTLLLVGRLGRRQHECQRRGEEKVCRSYPSGLHEPSTPGDPGLAALSR